MTFNPSTDSMPISMPSEQEPVGNQGFNPQRDSMPINMNQSGAVNLNKNPQDTLGVGRAIIGGVGNAEASSIESLGDAGIWAARKLGQVGQFISGSKDNTNLSEDEATKMRSDLHNNLYHNFLGTGIGLGNKEQPQNPLAQAISEHPVAGEGAEYTTDALNIAATGVKGLIPAIGVNAAIGAGIRGGSEHDQDMAALMSGGLTVAGSAVARAITTGAKANQVIKNIVSNYLKPVYDDLEANSNLSVGEKALKAEAANTEQLQSINKANYKEIETIPGTIPQRPIQQSVSDFLKDTGSKLQTDEKTGKSILDHSDSTLEDVQRKTLLKISQQASKMTTMENAINLRQYISSQRNLFTGKGVPTGVTQDVRDGYSNLLQKVDDSITQKAEEAGKGQILQKANSFYRNKITPLEDAGSFDRLDALKQKQQIDAFNQQNPQNPGSSPNALP